MPRIFPFAAWRPQPEYAEKVAAPPYDVLSVEEARAMARDNPLSFLHVDKAEIDLPPDAPGDGLAVYDKAKENLGKFLQSGAFTQDKTPCLYIYRLTAPDGRAQTGLAACLDVNDYNQGIIKKHELTRPDKERDRVAHINACAAHTGPIFIAYRAVEALRAQLDQWTQNHRPLYDFTKPDGVRHTLWRVNDAAAMDGLREGFLAVPYLYIADGHHRCAAAAKVAQADNEESGRFLAVMFPADELAILDYNRLVKDLNGLGAEGFLAAVEKDFTVFDSAGPVRPLQTHEYGLYMKGQWRALRYSGPPFADVTEGLAVSVLQNKLLAPILGIGDPQTDKRIDFVGGARGTEELERRVDSGEMAAAFSLCPTGLDELLAVADAGRIMPPKSTWFEPKLLSGLLVHGF